MQKIKTSLAFNITNHCNLNCNGCATLSNFGLEGHQIWDEQKSSITKWAEIIDLTEWTIYGGEPLINPDYKNWVNGLRELWPDGQGTIQTNGYAVTAKNTELYDIVNQANGKILINISLHDIDKLEETIIRIKSWLRGSIIETRYLSDDAIEDSRANWAKTYDSIRAVGWPECDHWDDFKNLPDSIQKECDQVFNFSDDKFKDMLSAYCFIDENNVSVIVKKIHFHYSGPLLPQPDFKTFKLHSSDIVKAHNSCSKKHCREIYNGKLYKCATVGHFSEFDNYYDIELTNEERDILHSYKPCSSDMSYDEIVKFIVELVNPIPQCRFCPDEVLITEIHASTKKISFQKKIDKSK